MSIKGKGIAKMLDQRQQLDHDIASTLIENPHCLDGDLQKERAYRVAIFHFVEKQQGSEVGKSNEPRGYIVSKKLQKLLSQYVNTHVESEQQEYARRIATYVLEANEKWLKLIPDATKDVAFQIIRQYLETQMRM